MLKASWCWWDQNFWYRWSGRKTLFFYLNVLRPGHLYHFDPIKIRRPWASEITIFCSMFINTKTFKPMKTRRHWLPIRFYIFSARPVSVLGHSFFYTWCVFDYMKTCVMYRYMHYVICICVSICTYIRTCIQSKHI